MSKPDCYKCKWRRAIPGDAHSSCTAEKAVAVKGHPTGVRGGWFQWPRNFDPTWLEECTGFDSKGGDDE